MDYLPNLTPMTAAMMVAAAANIAAVIAILFANRASDRAWRAIERVSSSRALRLASEHSASQTLANTDLGSCITFEGSCSASNRTRYSGMLSNSLRHAEYSSD